MISQVWLVCLGKCTHMYPAQSNQLHLILHIEDLLLVHGVAAVGRAVLLGGYDVRDVELILGQMAGQHAASLNVARGVGACQL